VQAPEILNFFETPGLTRRIQRAKNSPMKFEEALKKLEETVARMERGDLSLDASLKAFEDGIRLSRFLNAKLEEAEGKVEILLKDSKGNIVTAPFEEEPGPDGTEELPEDAEDEH